jgi:hypothetical protein
MNFQEIQAALDQVTFRDWVFHLGGGFGGPAFLQVRFWALDAATKEPALQSGRKWPLSPHMTKSEIVQTALKAVLTALEHEAREDFTYRGKPIFGPHFDVDFLASYCDLPFTQDAREPALTTAAAVEDLIE